MAATPDERHASGAAPAALAGTVERVTFYNPQNGFTVLRLRTRPARREPLTVVGTLPAVQPGEVLNLRGYWQTDPVHGAQFRAEEAEVRPPSARDDLVRYLGSGLIRQLGPVLAERIVAAFGDNALEVLDREPQRVQEVPGIGPQRARALAEAWREHRALRAVSAFLSAHGLHTGFALRLVRAYGEDAPRVLAANPYRLVAEVPGLGFSAADRLGRNLGVRPSAAARLQAAVHATLLRASERGHTRMNRGALLEAAAKLAGVEPELVGPAIVQLTAAGVISGESDLSAPPQAPLTQVESGLPNARSSRADEVRDVAGDKPPRYSGVEWDGAGTHRSRLKVYEPAAAYVTLPAEEKLAEPELGLGLAGMVRAEETLAERIAEMARRPSPLRPADVAQWLEGNAGARALSDEQRAAVARTATASCFVLTGGPGVGKTTTLRALVECLRALGREVALAAPTGKAAKRLGEVVGIEARTVHRLLGAGPKGFRHGQWEPLPYDTVIVDEASMLDTGLARSVVAAVGPRSQLILVGDADQLPSVGPGQVLRDLLATPGIPSAVLRTVFRQAAQSAIIRAAHAIRQGEMIELAPAGALARGIDCVFVPATAARVAEVGAEWAGTRLPRLLGAAPQEVQTVAPLTRVTQAVNGLLQARLNPARGQAERPHGALPLRTGDRMIHTRNNYTLGVFNGDTGTIAEITDAEVRVDFGDGRLVAYDGADVLDLEHAYCLTVHRSQGSEWPGVVILASSSFGPMLTRNLLYTALTRARRAAVIVGDTPAIEGAIANTRDQERNTGLAVLLARQMPSS